MLSRRARVAVAAHKAGYRGLMSSPLFTQVLEETGLHISDVNFLHASNCVHMEANKHYVTIIMSASVPEVDSVWQASLQPRCYHRNLSCFQVAVQINITVHTTSGYWCANLSCHSLPTCLCQCRSPLPLLCHFAAMETAVYTPHWCWSNQNRVHTDIAGSSGCGSQKFGAGEMPELGVAALGRSALTFIHGPTETCGQRLPAAEQIAWLLPQNGFDSSAQAHHIAADPCRVPSGRVYGNRPAEALL